MKIDREGIHIERALADEIAIEEELDSNVVGTYKFPSPERRRLAGWVFLVFALVGLVTVPGGWVVAVGFGALAGWQFLSSWPLAIDEGKALTIAAAQIGFTVGHSSSAVRFHGWRSRPRWAVVIYSANEPPDQRALVLVDGVDGSVIGEPFIERIAAV